MLTKVWGGWAAAGARLALVSAVAALGVTVEARAADDGQAPLWQGLGSVVGIGKPDDPVIDYREHSKLVLPPKMELPPPGAGGVTSAAWPIDQNVQRAKKLKALKDAPAARYVGKISTDPITQSGAVVTTSATAGAGAGGATCLKDGVAVTCPNQPAKTDDKPSRQIEWNPLTWVGLQKKADIVLGPEPERDFLTDPPPGLRTPAEGVGAKIQNN
jgi:hypothetical protein